MAKDENYMHAAGCDKECDDTCSDNRPWDYVVIVRFSSGEIMDAVKEKEREGYSLAGGISVWLDAGGEICFAQAMWRKPIIYYLG